MLVYLDSAHLALLERASISQREAFLSTWRAYECELALSLHHLQEIAQLADRASVEHRLKVLEVFPSIRCKPAGINLVLKLEIQLQLLTLLGFRPDIRRSAVDTLFPKVDISEIRAATIDLQPLFKLMRTAHEMGADASNTSKQASQLGPPVSMRRAIDPPQLDSPAVREAFEAALTDMPPDVQALTRQMYQLVRTSIQDHGSARRALENIYNLAKVEALGRIPDSDLAIVAGFFNSARKEVDEVLSRVGAEPSTGEQLVRRLDPYAAPGFSLQLAVQRARKRHPKPEEPGDDLDVAHVGFAPYVDVLFADKRTFGFVVQEARDNPERLASCSIGAIERAGNLEQAAEVIAKRSALA
ncbi:MAG TPA: hypothetical protein VF746_32335 [Longimicrobium sp.]